MSREIFGNGVIDEEDPKCRGIILHYSNIEERIFDLRYAGNLFGVIISGATFAKSCHDFNFDGNKIADRLMHFDNIYPYFYYGGALVLALSFGIPRYLDHRNKRNFEREYEMEIGRKPTYLDIEF
ncbi:MAG TPA: hypothetical protein VJJ23_04685 [Candidatus Nanoarchaeia archaeon]|nr:hypothetical protein [Candidatus Nanoarchaeia archaeon]